MTDRFVVRTVVLGLLGIALSCVVACVVLALAHVDLPEFIKYVGTTAIGAFAGVLAKTSTEPQPVVIKDEPVETVAVPAGRRKRGDAGITTLGFVLAVVILLLLAAAIGGLS